MEKSTRFKITGDSAETLDLCWLSKPGCECANVNHTGIDLIACSKDGSKRMSVSLEPRSCYDGTEQESIKPLSDNFEKARQACKSFGCIPFYAVLVDSAGGIRWLFASFRFTWRRLLQKRVARGGICSRVRACWNVAAGEPEIRWFELRPVKFVLVRRRQIGLGQCQ